MAKDFKEKKTWYTPVAEIYHQARPKYPQTLIDQAMILAKLNPSTEVLELGCGSGNATIAFAHLDLPMTCLEINSEFCRLAQHNCRAYPQVEIYNTSFEEWKIESKFHAVLSANAFHWFSPKVKYAKVAASLKNNGFLILLWNLTPEPPLEIFQALNEIYQVYTPSLFKYEGAAKQAKILTGFQQDIEDSGYFEDFRSEQVACILSYGIDEYINLTSTLRRLNTETQKLLFPR